MPTQQEIDHYNQLLGLGFTPTGFTGPSGLPILRPPGSNIDPTGGLMPGGGVTPSLPSVPASPSGALPNLGPTLPGLGGGGGYGGPYGGFSTGSPSSGGGNPNAWYNTFLGQTAINTGFNLLGGILQNRSLKGAEKQNRKDIENRIRQALAALSPEHIMALSQQFLPQMAANASTAGQTAIQGVRAQAARTGQLEGPRALSYEAGTRAKLASDVQRQAFEGAFNLAQGQANAITGAPYTPIAPKTGYADALLNSVNQAYYARARTQPPTTAPFKYPGFGSTVTDPRAFPEFNRLEGTPYQWGFTPARY